MNVTRFHADDAWQREVRDRLLVPEFYEVRAPGRYVLMDRGRLAGIVQRTMAVDTICQGKAGDVISIEEKIVRWPGRVYDAVCLETDSCTLPGYEKPGWMHYGEADFLLYCMAMDDAATSLSCHLFDFQKLREWFWPLAETFPVFQMETRNQSRGRSVPIKAISEAVPYWRFPVPRERTAA